MRKTLFMNIKWNGIALNTEDRCNWRIKFTNVEIYDHYCPDNVHQGIRKVTKQVIRNTAALSFNFQFQCITCSWFGAINFVFEVSPQKEVHGREVWGTRSVFNGIPSSNPCAWKSCVEVSSYIAMVVGRCSILLKVTLVVITKHLWNFWTDKLLKQLKCVHFLRHLYVFPQP